MNYDNSTLSPDWLTVVFEFLFGKRCYTLLSPQYIRKSSYKFDKTRNVYKHLLGNKKIINVTASNFRALFLNFKHFL